MSAQSREVFIYGHLDSAAKTVTVVSVHASWPEAHRAANEGTGAFRSALPVRASAERPLPGDVLRYELVTPGGVVAVANEKFATGVVAPAEGYDGTYVEDHCECGEFEPECVCDSAVAGAVTPATSAEG